VGEMGWGERRVRGDRCVAERYGLGGRMLGKGDKLARKMGWVRENGWGREKSWAERWVGKGERWVGEGKWLGE